MTIIVRGQSRPAAAAGPTHFAALRMACAMPAQARVHGAAVRYLTQTAAQRQLSLTERHTQNVDLNVEVDADATATAAALSLLQLPASACAPLRSVVLLLTLDSGPTGAVGGSDPARDVQAHTLAG